jgi:hypothetical protein
MFSVAFLTSRIIERVQVCARACEREELAIDLAMPHNPTLLGPNVALTKLVFAS